MVVKRRRFSQSSPFFHPDASIGFEIRPSQLEFNGSRRFSLDRANYRSQDSTLSFTVLKKVSIMSRR